MTDTTKQTMNSTTTPETITQDLQDLEKKYNDLVWYARSPHKSMIRVVYKDTPEDIIQGALNSQARVEEDYPDEIDNLKGKDSDWEHGFNSGMLAAIRYVLTATCPIEIEDEFGEMFMSGGLEEAKEEFPMLDT